MEMADLTLISKGFVASGSSLKEYNFNMPKLYSSGEVSKEYSIPIDTKQGVLNGLRVASPTSRQFEISIRNQSGITPPSSGEIYRVFDSIVSGEFAAYNLSIPFKNMDSPQTEKLYLYIKNTDTLYETGLIEVTLQIHE